MKYYYLFKHMLIKDHNYKCFELNYGFCKLYVHTLRISYSYLHSSLLQRYSNSKIGMSPVKFKQINNMFSCNFFLPKTPVIPTILTFMRNHTTTQGCLKLKVFTQFFQDHNKHFRVSVTNQ